jgi:hypothetical protein
MRLQKKTLRSSRSITSKDDFGRENYQAKNEGRLTGVSLPFFDNPKTNLTYEKNLYNLTFNNHAKTSLTQNLKKERG